MDVTSIEPAFLKPVARVLENSGYSPFSAPGDRHGSWEWPFFRAAKDLTRFVILSVTPVDDRGTLLVELWVGAQAADQRFMRKLSYSERIGSEELLDIRELTKQIGLAIREAGALRPDRNVGDVQGR